MRHDEQRAGPRLQEALEPQHGVKVEMVRGLIEQKHVGVDEQRARQRHAHAPTTGETRARAVHHLVREGQTAQNGLRAELGGVGVDLVHAGIDLVQAVHVRLAHRQKLLLLPHQLRALDVGVQHDLEGGVVRAENLLLDVEDLDVGVHVLELTLCEHAQQRRLATAVAADETVLLAGEDVQRGVVEEGVLAHVHVDVLAADVVAVAAALVAAMHAHGLLVERETALLHELFVLVLHEEAPLLLLLFAALQLDALLLVVPVQVVIRVHVRVLADGVDAGALHRLGVELADADGLRELALLRGRREEPLVIHKLQNLVRDALRLLLLLVALEAHEQRDDGVDERGILGAARVGLRLGVEDVEDVLDDAGVEKLETVARVGTDDQTGERRILTRAEGVVKSWVVHIDLIWNKKKQ
eukprot:PhM_4_TR12419/c0_g1_i1/m.34319